MELHVEEWKEFTLNRVFTLKGGFYNKKPEHSKDGNIPFLASTESNNGVTEYYCIDDIQSWDKVGESDNSLDKKLFDGNCIAVTVNGSVCNAFYQRNQFSCSHDITSLYLKKHEMNVYIGQFISTVIMMDKYRWNYGRKPHDVSKFGKSILKLPIQTYDDGTPILDEKKTFSDDGYIPDWQFMENYIKSLNCEPPKTKIDGKSIEGLNAYDWEEFTVSDLFNVQYGINMELNACDETTCDDPEGIAFVARTSENNGVSAYVKRINGKEPQAAETITVAGGGSVLSTFVQKRPFYSGRDLYLLLPKTNMSLKTKMFICTVLSANQYRYSYGRQANKTLPYLILKLPILRDINKNPVIDETHMYSKKGYIPDWEWMESYINSFPYSDRI